MTNHVFLRPSRGSLSLLAITLVALALTLSNGFAKPANSDKSSAPESKFTTLDGARIHYMNYGKGHVAFLLIEVRTMKGDTWRENAPALAKRMRLFAFYWRGPAQCEKPQTT